jgi:hypothetical protein
MTLPKTRISITLAEYALVVPGIHALVRGFAAAKQGNYPHRHAFDRIDLTVSDIYRDQAYDAEMGQRIMTVACEVFDMTATRKIRLDVFDLATAAMALRVAGTLARNRGTSLETRSVDDLRAKLERYRKRAQRQAVTKIGEAAYAVLAETWKKYQGWVRYNLLQLKVAKPAAWNNKPLMREQRARLVTMITRSLAEHQRMPLPPAEVARMALLAKNALRRGRMTMTLRELLEAGRAGRDLLFAFVEKRIMLAAPEGAKSEPWRAAMERADKFNAWCGEVPSAPRY